MGKPIAGRDKSPFGVDGINVDAAVLNDGTKLTNVRISKQRSSSMFDLLSTDGETIYEFVQLTGKDATGANLVVGTSAADLDLAPGTFCISAVGVDGDAVGFATKLMLNKIILQDGSVLYITDYNSQGEIVVSVTSVTVTPDDLDLKVGDTSTLTSTVEPSNATNKTVAWSSSAADIASVSDVGLVTALKNGTATITATTADGGKTDTASVSVTTSVTGVTVSPTTASLTSVGATQQITTTVAPATASDKSVTYVSDATNVATVSSDGLITAISNGTANINVTTTDGAKTATVVVTVTISE